MGDSAGLEGGLNRPRLPRSTTMNPGAHPESVFPRDDTAPFAGNAFRPLREAGIAVPLWLALLWGQLFWALHPSWIHGNYYDYGWIIPPIAAWFFWRRWHGEALEFLRPVSAPRSRRGLLLLSIVLGAAALIAALGFVRILERFDPIWRVPLFLHAAVVAVVTHLVIALGRGWRFSLACLPLTLFALTAVPWPAGIETRIIGEMTDRLLAVSVPISRFLLGVPVEMSGSALIAEGRVIQIDEGCSGIRSFQSLLMAGLFVGEFMMLRWGARAFLIGAAIVFGFVLNTARASVLTWIFFHRGEGAFHAAHDLVGFTAFGISAALLLGLGALLDRWAGGEASLGAPLEVPRANE